MDEISKQRILEQIEKENFNSLKYLKEQYFEFKAISLLQNKIILVIARSCSVLDPPAQASQCPFAAESAA